MRKLSFGFLYCIIVSCAWSLHPPEILFEQKEYDFGTVLPEEEVVVPFLFKNTGEKTLLLHSVRAACPCTEITHWDRCTVPGDGGKIIATLKAPRINGRVTKVIFVQSNDPDHPSLQLRLSGEVLIPVEIIPENLWLGNASPGVQFLEGYFTIRNHREVPLIAGKVLVPPLNLTYELITLTRGENYRLEFKILPPFPGEGTVTHYFRLIPEGENGEEIELGFSYFKAPVTSPECIPHP